MNKELGSISPEPQARSTQKKILATAYELGIAAGLFANSILVMGRKTNLLTDEQYIEITGTVEPLQHMTSVGLSWAAILTAVAGAEYIRYRLEGKNRTELGQQIKNIAPAVGVAGAITGNLIVEGAQIMPWDVSDKVDLMYGIGSIPLSYLAVKELHNRRNKIS